MMVSFDCTMQHLKGEPRPNPPSLERAEWSAWQ